MCLREIELSSLHGWVPVELPERHGWVRAELFWQTTATEPRRELQCAGTGLSTNGRLGRGSPPAMLSMFCLHVHEPSLAEGHKLDPVALLAMLSSNWAASRSRRSPRAAACS
ncbi:unnamed protein product [Urochloa humidicola]